MRATSTVASTLLVRAGQRASSRRRALVPGSTAISLTRKVDVDEPRLLGATLAQCSRLRTALHLERRCGRCARPKVDRLDEQEIVPRLGHRVVVERERENGGAG